MKNNQTLAQILLRIALSASFLSAVADRFGLWGAPGAPFVSWGNWENFVDYSNSVNSFLSPTIGKWLAVLATGLEIILPILLIVGYKIKYASLLSALLLLSFALSMMISFKIKAPLDYSVFTGAAAAFLLSTIPKYRFSLDDYLLKKKQ
ncbi:MAG: DoxX family membrane protein [Pedobacter sp.]|nr:MAG: DoxX family membrane protein [Pedobacter sp.]